MGALPLPPSERPRLALLLALEHPPLLELDFELFPELLGPAMIADVGEDFDSEETKAFGNLAMLRARYGGLHRTLSSTGSNII